MDEFVMTVTFIVRVAVKADTYDEAYEFARETVHATSDDETLVTVVAAVKSIE